MVINLIVVPKADIIPGIDAARNILNHCWFDEIKCEKGIRALENYKKKWMKGKAVGQAIHYIIGLVMVLTLLELLQRDFVTSPAKRSH